MSVNIQSYINYAKVGQFNLADKYAKDALLRGINIVPDYVSLLRVIRETVQNQYALTGETTALDGLANYMYALSGLWSTTISNPATTFLIIIQPTSLTVNSGDNASFLVAVAGGTQPYNYQWYFNNVALSGETDPTLDLTSVDSGDAGNYKVIITDDTGQVLTSNTAILTVNAAAITGSYYYGSTDYFSALNGGTDNITYQGTFPITHNANISVPYPLAAGNNMFLVIRVPRTESIKSNWFNTSFNYGTIQPPDGIFRAPLLPAGLPNYTYYLTELQVSNDFNSPLILS